MSRSWDLHHWELGVVCTLYLEPYCSLQGPLVGRGELQDRTGNLRTEYKQYSIFNRRILRMGAALRGDGERCALDFDVTRQGGDHRPQPVASAAELRLQIGDRLRGR